MEEESSLVTAAQQLGIRRIYLAREKVHCSFKEFPEISTAYFGNLLHV
jgi:hypothetical protein